MNNNTVIALVIAGVVVIASIIVRLAAVYFDPRWRRRTWCVYCFGIGGALLGGVWVGIADGHPEGVLVASALCAILGALAGNVVRILSGPARQQVREEALR